MISSAELKIKKQTTLNIHTILIKAGVSKPYYCKVIVRISIVNLFPPFQWLYTCALAMKAHSRLEFRLADYLKDDNFPLQMVLKAL